MGRSPLPALLLLLCGAMLSMGHSCRTRDDDDYCRRVRVDDEYVCVYDDDNSLPLRFNPLPQAEAGVLLKGTRDSRFERVTLVVTKIELLGEKTQVLFDDPTGMTIDLCEGGDVASAYDRVLARGTVTPGSSTAIRLRYRTVACVDRGAGSGADDRVQDLTGGEIDLALDAPIPIEPGGRAFFVATFDLATSFRRPSPDEGATGAAWSMWLHGSARKFDATAALR